MFDFDKKVQSVLDAYNHRLEAESAWMKTVPIQEILNRRDEFLLAVGKDTACFLYTLARSSNARIILEIGTSFGYSTLWLACAAKATNGTVITLELDKRKADYAREKIDEAGLSDYVEFRVGDALASIQQAEEEFDFVLLDLWKELYTPCLELFYPKLKPGAYVVADNMIFPADHKEEVEAYRKAVKAKNAFDTILLPIGSGLEVSHLRNNKRSAN